MQPTFAAFTAFGSVLLAGVVCYGIPQAAQIEVAPPDFARASATAWVPDDVGFMPPVSGPGPVIQDPAHRYVSNQEANRLGTQPTFHMGDATSAILQPWAKEALRNWNDAILAGKPGFTRQVSCWPNGTPAFLLYAVQPIYFIQTPKKVLMTSQFDHMTRRVFLNVPHSENVKPSWFGESVGHYEGDTLVVDTIGLNDKTSVDNFRTPHTAQLHVIERYRIVDDGKTLEVKIHVEDPGAFTTPWDAIQRYRRVEERPMFELPCADGNPDYFNHFVEPIPTADKPDF